MLKALMFLTAAFSGFLLTPANAFAAQSIPEDSSSAVILSYGRIGEDSYPDTNLRTGQFDAHLQELIDGEYHVITLPDLIAALKNHTKLEPRTVAITFDGAYRSTYENAIPKLLARGLPFTVFYAADHTASDTEQHMNLSELQSLHYNKLVTLGILPSNYARLSDLDTAEIRRLVSKAKKFHRDHFGKEAPYFSYPYGEYTPEIANVTREHNFEAGFGIHSGVVYPALDLQFLPRFSMTESFGSLERFLMVTHALPLPVSDVQPNPPVFETAPVQIGFSVSRDLTPGLESLSCFLTGQDHIQTEIIGNRIEIRSADTIEADRLRLNCTMPGPSNLGEAAQWRWFGLLMTRQGHAPDHDAEDADSSENFSAIP